LKYLSGSRLREIEVHLCPEPCDARLWRDDLLHGQKLRKAEGPKDPWMDNLVEKRRIEEADVDMNQELRREAELAMQEARERERERETPKRWPRRPRKKRARNERRSRRREETAV
jgi:hypothetical protein